MAYAINVSSNRTNGIKNTHHVKLTQGATVIPLILCDAEGKPDPFQLQPNPNPRTPLRISQGETSYGDINPHLTSYPHLDFSGGRGYEAFEDEKSGYNDARGANTAIPYKVFPGGQYGFAKGVRTWYGQWLQKGYYDGPGESLVYSYLKYINAQNENWYAVKIIPSATFTAKWVEFIVRIAGSGGGFGPLGAGSGAGNGLFCVDVSLYSNASSKPNAVLETATVDHSYIIAPYSDGYPQVDDAYDFNHIRVPFNTSLSSGVTYWLVFKVYYSSGSAVDNSAVLMHGVDYTLGEGLMSLNGTDWSAASSLPFCRVTPADDDIKGYFQSYKGTFYSAINYLDLATTPQLMVNGWHGVPVTTGTTASNIAVSGTPWTTNQHRRSICYIWDGTGANSERPWRIIESNTDNDLVFTTDPWDFIPDTSTVFCIIASDVWTAISGSGWGTSSQISDMKEASGTLYMAMGPNVAIKMLSAYNNAGTWTNTWDSVTSTYADLLQTITEGGQTIIWKAERLSSEIAAAPAPDNMGGSSTEPNFVYNSSTNPYAVNEFDVGNLMYRITSLSVYGDYPHLWVLKEDKPYEIVNNDPYEFRLGQISATWDFRNGVASCHHDNFIYWSFQQSLERWHSSGSMKHMGPDVIGESGMPENRRGNFVKLVGYGNLLIGAYDGGKDNFSTILAWNGRGWHEMFRSPWRGARILGLGVQSVPGDAVDRLWFTCGSDLMWLPLTTNQLNIQAIAYNHYPYAHSYTIETGWIYYTLREEEKYFDSVKGIIQDFQYWTSPSIKLARSWAEVAYKVDEQSAWSYIDDGIYGTDNQSVELSADKDIVTRRIKFKIYVYNANNRNVGLLLGLIYNLALNLDQKHIFRLQFRVRDYDEDLWGHPDSSYVDGIDKITDLRIMSDAKIPVKMNTYDPTMDNIWGFIEYPSIRVRHVIDHEGRITRVCQLFLREI